ncbi:MAG: hypothetical protein ACRC92_26565 [Peptostreptococcaceae bacterium]
MLCTMFVSSYIKEKMGNKVVSGQMTEVDTMSLVSECLEREDFLNQVIESSNTVHNKRDATNVLLDEVEIIRLTRLLNNDGGACL